MGKIISLRGFLLAGEFGGIRADTHPDHVTGLLGEPTHRYDEDNSLIYFLYGAYEIAFMDHTAMYVQNHAMHCHESDRQFQNQHVTIDPWIFDRRTPLTKPEVITALAAVNAVYRHVIYNDREAIEMDCGVVLDFNPSLDDPARHVCDAVSLTFPAFRRALNEFAE